jgi:hypothetical protein
MAQSILIFDFGTNEETAQQARHKIEAWQQGSRLGKKMLLKFDRKESANGAASPAAPSEKPAARAKSAKGKTASSEAAQAGADAGSAARTVRLMVRLDFSDHEKLTSQRWLVRFASEEPFKSSNAQTVRQGSSSFATTAELFDSLD